MWKTIVGIIVSFALLLAGASYEIFYVNTAVQRVREQAIALFRLTEEERATHEDGNALRLSWENEKRKLHIWLPHTAIENVDYHLNEALGYLYQENYADALPKIEVIIDMAENIIRSISLLPENIL